MTEAVLAGYLEERLSPAIGTGRVFPLFTTDVSRPCVTYTLHPLTGGAVGQYQVEVRAISEDYDTGAALRGAIKSALHTGESAPAILRGGFSFRGELAGGGAPLFNEEIQQYEFPLIFIIRAYER